MRLPVINITKLSNLYDKIFRKTKEKEHEIDYTSFEEVRQLYDGEYEIEVLTDEKGTIETFTYQPTMVIKRYIIKVSTSSN